ncbi:hypothetical protein WJX72_006028 [[Myrmecia] bisecta]|uniref:Uncharacterized protein n=1 Tax=[Myrmecia] bisecta TaxID=41462 RepID=A0AAW1PTI6_9CHLO
MQMCDLTSNDRLKVSFQQIRMVTVGDLVVAADLQDTSKHSVKTALARLGYPQDHRFDRAGLEVRYFPRVVNDFLQPLYRHMFRTPGGNILARLDRLEERANNPLISPAARDKVEAASLMRGIVMCISRRGHHMVYECKTWPCDLEASLVLYDGEVLGMHKGGVNSIREIMDRKRTLKESMTEVEESLESAARSVAQGAVALLATAFPQV